MPEATIEIRTKSIFGSINIPKVGVAQHTFIIYTDSSGNQIAFRGGPPGFGPITTGLGAFVGNVKVTEGAYIEGHPDFIDQWPTAYPGQVIFKGTDAQMYQIVEKMRVAMNGINNGNFDYKIPTGIGHLQNSNTG